MDLTINLEDYKLNIRAGAIIIHNNKVLTHKNKNEKHYALIGGRVELGEDSETTIKRELKEELGKDVQITGYITTVENFFEDNGKKFHEILFVHRAEFINEDDKKINYPLKNMEGNDNLQYEWIDINKIDSYPLLPITIKEMLKSHNYKSHIINK